MAGREFLTLNLVDRPAPSADKEENTSTSWIGASNENLFADPYDRTRPKRLRWLCLSLAFQALVVGFLVLRSVTAESELPSPRVVKTFLAVAPTPPPPPPAAVATPAPSSSVASKRPLVAPPIRLAALVPSAIPVDMGDSTGFGFDEGVEGGVPGGIIGGLVGGLGGILVPSGPGIYVVTREFERPEKLVHIDPVYPAIATAARVEGLVILEATINSEGNVENLRVLRSIPLLDAAAVEAVKRWKYEPTVIAGTPVPIVMTVTVRFALA